MSARLSSLLGVILVLLSVGQITNCETLTVAAASDLTNVEIPLAAAFRKNEPKVDIRWVTSASGVITQQIENGAPYDVFLSANAAFVDRLAQAGKIEPTTVLSYAKGRVGILWKDGKHHELKDLKEGSVRIVALPNPKLAPYGVAAQQALEHAGVWDEVSKKLVYGENVRQTLQLFESGNADAVLTSDSLLQGRNAAVVPSDWHQPILQKGGVVSASQQRKIAENFLRFLISPEGQHVFESFGFDKP